jgi:short-subunit dehydrogenase
MLRLPSHGTAAITGASDGIGEAFARQLANRGHSLILIARRMDRLNRLRDELVRDFGIGVEVRRADLSQTEDVQSLAADLSEHADLDLLINAAGFGTMGDFVDVDSAKHLDMIQVHVSATVTLTHAVLPAMLERQRGAIINVASMSAFLIGPGQSTYAASKVFLKTFSESLFEEVRERGVYVQALCPGFTRTGFHDTAEFKKFDRGQIAAGLWMTPQEVVEESLQALDSGRSAVCVPSSKNRWLVRAMRLEFVRRLAGKNVRKKNPVE